MSTEEAVEAVTSPEVRQQVRPELDFILVGSDMKEAGSHKEVLGEERGREAPGVGRAETLTSRHRENLIRFSMSSEVVLTESGAGIQIIAQS